jgi:hypothetical protein
MGRNNDGGGKGWVTVNRGAQKDAEREERRLRKQEEREAEERAATGGIVGASSGYDWINGPAGGFLAHIGAAAGKAQAQDRNVVDVPPPAATTSAVAALVANTAAAKKQRAAEEKEAAEKEAATRKKKQEAAQRHARLNDRSTWPALTERLLEIASTLGGDLDNLHTDSITADKEALRLHYAIATVQRAVGDRVAPWESTVDGDAEVEEDGACAESMASVLEPLCAVERDGAFIRDVSGRDLLQALDAHGRATTSAAAVLEAVQNAYFAIQPALPEAGAATRSTAARLAVQAVLRASSWVVAANLGAVVDHFAPRVCHPAQGVRSDKPAKAAPSQMDFILRLVLQYVAATPDGQGSEYGVLRAGISKFLNALAALGPAHAATPILLNAATPFLRGAASWLHEAEEADEVVMDDEALGRKYVKAPALHPDAAQLLLGASQLETGVRMVLLRELGLYASRAGAGAITSRLVRLAGVEDETASIAAAAAVFAASGLRTAIDAAALCLSTAPAGLGRTLAAMPKGQIPTDLATAIAARGKELVDGKAASLPAKRVAEVNEVIRAAAGMKRVAAVTTAVPAPARATAAPSAAASTAAPATSAAAAAAAATSAAGKNGKKTAAAAAPATGAAPAKGTTAATKKGAATAAAAPGSKAQKEQQKSGNGAVGTIFALAAVAAAAAAAFVAHSSGVF